jgi:hypothetical protein
MVFVLLVLIHFGAVYIGAHLAQLEYVDTWRIIVVTLASYVVMIVVALLLFPLALVPVINLFVGPAVLCLGTAFAAKMILSCDWQPAWIIGGSAAVINLLAGWMLSGCA